MIDTMKVQNQPLKHIIWQKEKQDSRGSWVVRATSRVERSHTCLERSINGRSRQEESLFLQPSSLATGLKLDKAEGSRVSKTNCTAVTPSDL